MHHFYAIILGLFCFTYSAQGQTYIQDSILKTVMIEVHYIGAFPVADLSDRFGYHSHIGTGVHFKTRKNVVFGLEGSFVFGKTVKEVDILDPMINSDGYIIGTSGLYETVDIAMKGFSFGFRVGKIISFKRPNPNSGLLVTGSFGFLQHKISIDANENTIPQLDKERRKGYDRLTNGPLLTQFIGYQFMDPKKRLNVFFGVEIGEAFTKNRRSWNYDEKRQDDRSRKDLYIGFKAGWVLPLYLTATEKYYYY